MRDLVEPHNGIRLIHIAEQRQIGAKRNYGCSRASGEYICHWDDDDYSEPERIASQIAALEANPQYAVTGYHSMRFTDGRLWWKYSGNMNYALGTSLCYRHSWWKDHPFRSQQIGEDNDFVATAWALRSLHTDDAGLLMYATIHGENTSPRQIGSAWTRIEV